LSFGHRRTVVQAVVILVMVAAPFALAGFVAPVWGAGLSGESLALGGMGIGLTATSLLLLRKALNPNGAEGRWKPPPGTLRSPPHRLTWLGCSLWFGAIGVVFLRGAVLGGAELTVLELCALLGALAAGVALMLVGAAYARRRGEAARAIQVALLEYAGRHDGWFPKGEASPEASLSLLHRENPGQVTADVLRGRTAPEATVRARLEAGELLTPETCGWHYAEGLRRTDDPRLALFWDKAGRGYIEALLSGGDYFVFFVGGSIEYVLARRWEEFLAEQERLRAAVKR
jgi:hypothetical protein